MDQKATANGVDSAAATATPKISFASAATGGSASPSSSTGSANKPEARTIIFGAYNSPTQANSPARSSHSSNNTSNSSNNNNSKNSSSTTGNNGKNNNINNTNKTGTGYVYIPRTQSAPPKENEIVPNPVPAQPPTPTATQPTTKTTIGGFHVDAAPYNPNAPIFMPAGSMAPPFVHASPYYPPPPVSGYMRPGPGTFMGPPRPPVNNPPSSTPAHLDASVASTAAAVAPLPVGQPPQQQPQPPVPTLPPRQPSKALKIVDPKTKQELKLDAIPKVTAPAKPEMTISNSNDATAVAAPVVDVEPAATSKALPIVDPTSHKPIVITKDEHGHLVSDKQVDMSNVEQALNALTFDDDDDVSDISSEDSVDFDDSGLLRPGQTISYPEKYLAYETPSPGGVWRYSRRFLIQFMPVCTQKPDKASFFSRVARKEHHSGGRGRRQKKILTEAEREAIMLSLNKTANAWAPVADEKTLAEEERILREAKGILNKLTMEKFDVLSDKIIALGINSQNVQGGMIDLLFDKSTDEPKFASMYAMLCLKIALKDLEESRSSTDLRTSPSSTSASSVASSSKAESKFRRLLLEKCQYEFKNKRDWSSKRQAAAEARPKSAASSGELTEEDYELIKVKRRVLGNMRFIGELFMQGLLGEKIMHMIINELSQNQENPEEDEVECLCKLLTTVGKRLDHGESIQIMNLYMDRMKNFYKHPNLCSRIRFACLDVIELRGRAWLTKEEPLKTLAQVQQQAPFSSPSSMASASPGGDSHPPRRTASKGESSSRDRRNNGDVRLMDQRDRQERPRLVQRQSSAEDGDGWKMSGGSGWDASAAPSSTANINNNSNSRSKSQGGRSFTLKDLKEQNSRSSSPQSSIQSMTTAANATPSNPSQPPQASQPLNRFMALDHHDDAHSQERHESHSEHTQEQQSGHVPPQEQSPSDAVFKAMAMYDEFVSVNSMEGLLERVSQVKSADMPLFCETLLLKVIDSPKAYLEKFPIFIASTRNTYNSDVWVQVVRRVCQQLDDLSVDIPNACFAFGAVVRCLSEQALLAGRDPLECAGLDGVSLVSRFKVTGHVAPKRLDALSIDPQQLSSVDRKLLSQQAVRYQWYKQSALAADLAFRHRIEQLTLPHGTPNPSFFFASAKAIIASDFLNSSLAPLKGLSIVLQFGFAELRRDPSSADGVEMMLALASPFLNDLAVANTPHDKIAAVVREAAGGEAVSLADSFISHLKH